jgi:DNA-directed RNA polymerase specialized sigma24 family protein
MDPVAATSPLPPARPLSESNWGPFVDSYGRAILNWLRQSGLPTLDAEALTSDLMRHIRREFNQIASEPNLSFRTWLKHAGHAAWFRLMETGGDYLGTEHSPALAILLSVEAHDAFLNMLDAECSHLRRHEVLPRIPPLVEPADWEAFYLAVLEDVSMAEVAARLHCTELAAHAAVYRVGKLLREQLRALEDKC